jgi:hypothetical protein
MGGGVYKSLMLRCKLLFFITQFVLFSKSRRDILHVAFASVFQNTGKLSYVVLGSLAKSGSSCRHVVLCSSKRHTRSSYGDHNPAGFQNMLESRALKNNSLRTLCLRHFSKRSTAPWYVLVLGKAGRHSHQPENPISKNYMQPTAEERNIVTLGSPVSSKTPQAATWCAFVQNRNIQTLTLVSERMMYVGTPEKPTQKRPWYMWCEIRVYKPSSYLSSLSFIIFFCSTPKTTEEASMCCRPSSFFLKRSTETPCLWSCRKDF